MTQSTDATTSRLVVGSAADAAGPLPATGPRAGADAGDPQTSTLVFRAGDERAPEVGVWECTPGSWTIENRPDAEVCVILSGRARMTDEGGEPVEIGPGDTLVLPRGWSGRWEILEPLRKIFVIS
jgi:uncharacterized cupin superfamily protein